jgi:hypothetical protein
MIPIKVSYDAYNQEFRLVEPKYARMFEDGETYVLAVDFLPTDLDTVEGESIDLTTIEIGNA